MFRKPPVIPGHEFVGTVVKIGERARSKFGLKEGDLTVAEQLVTCGTCWHCRNGGSNKCDNLKIYGQAIDGAMAEFMIYKGEGVIHRVPDGLSAEQAVLAEPLAVSIHAVDQANIDISESQVFCVAGCGTIGLGVIATLRNRYPKCFIAAIDYFDFKLRLARENGANFTVLVDDIESGQRKLREICGEKGGVDVYFEASGHSESVEQGIRLTRKRGRFVHIGICVQECVTCNWNAISAGKELKIIGSSLGVGCWPEAFTLLQKGALSNIITHNYSLKDFKDAFDLGMNPQNALKVIISPSTKVSSVLQQGFKLFRSIKFGGCPAIKTESEVCLFTNVDRPSSLALAQDALSKGHIAVIHCSKDSRKSLMEKFHGSEKVLILHGDFGNMDHVRRISHAVITEFGRLDCLFLSQLVINNSASIDMNDVSHAFSSIMADQVLSHIQAILEFLPLMKRQGSGRIVFVEQRSDSANTNSVLQNMCNSAILHYLNSLKEQFKKDDVRVEISLY